MQYLFAALLAMGITVMLIPLLIRWADHLGVQDQPGTRKVHTAPIPRVGGIAMAVGMLVSMLVWGTASEQLRAYLIATPVLLAFGIQDDRLTLSPKWKLIGQILAAMLVMYLGDLHVGIVRHVDTYEVPNWLSWPITLLFIVGVTNAVNLADGLDGLAGGIALLCVCGLLLMALTGGSMSVAFACLVIVGALLGFLRYNTHPARIFMGDAGSQLLGFSAAVFSLILTQDRQLPFSAALPLLLLGVPVIDTLTVMTERIIDGKSPFQADRNHIHHRLLALGFHHHEAVMVVYLVQTFMLVMAWQLRFASDAVILMCFLTMAATIVISLRMARHRQWALRKSVAEQRHLPSMLGTIIEWFRQDAHLNRWTGRAICSVMLVYLFLVALARPAVSLDTRVMSGFIAAFLLVNTLIRWTNTVTSFLERGLLYVSVLIVVVINRVSIVADSHRWIEVMLFVVLALAVVVRLHLASDRRFKVSPLDVLVVVLAIALPNLPGSWLSGYELGGVVLKTLLLMYGIETLAAIRDWQWRTVTAGMLVFLTVIAIGTN